MKREGNKVGNYTELDVSAKEDGNRDLLNKGAVYGFYE